MDKPLSSEENNALDAVREGMRVHDAKNTRVGTVTDVVLGNVENVPTNSELSDTPGVVAAAAPYGGMGSSNPAIAAFDSTGLPEPLAARLRRNGYIKVDGGLLAGKFYVQPHQVASVTENEVHLNVPKTEVIKG
jgi:hypothetical protein